MLQNWLMLNRLCSSSSTNHTLLIEVDELPIVPVPIIFPNWLPPNFTFPSSFIVRDRNIDFSRVMCLEQPLSRYHDFCFDLAFRQICSIENFRFRYPLCNALFYILLILVDFNMIGVFYMKCWFMWILVFANFIIFYYKEVVMIFII